VVRCVPRAGCVRRDAIPQGTGVHDGGPRIPGQGPRAWRRLPRPCVSVCTQSCAQRQPICLLLRAALPPLLWRRLLLLAPLLLMQLLLLLQVLQSSTCTCTKGNTTLVHDSAHARVWPWLIGREAHALWQLPTWCSLVESMPRLLLIRCGDLTRFSVASRAHGNSQACVRVHAPAGLMVCRTQDPAAPPSRWLGGPRSPNQARRCVRQWECGVRWHCEEGWAWLGK